jgi:hypothetical protein
VSFDSLLGQPNGSKHKETGELSQTKHSYHRTTLLRLGQSQHFYFNKHTLIFASSNQPLAYKKAAGRSVPPHKGTSFWLFRSVAKDCLRMCRQVILKYTISSLFQMAAVAEHGVCIAMCALFAWVWNGSAAGRWAGQQGALVAASGGFLVDFAPDPFGTVRGVREN